MSLLHDEHRFRVYYSQYVELMMETFFSRCERVLCFSLLFLGAAALTSPPLDGFGVQELLLVLPFSTYGIPVNLRLMLTIRHFVISNCVMNLTG